MEVLTSARMNEIVDAINGISGTLIAEFKNNHIYKSGTQTQLNYTDLNDILSSGQLILLNYNNSVLIPTYLKSDTGLDAIGFNSIFNLSNKVYNAKVVINSLDEITDSSVQLANSNLVTSASDFNINSSYQVGDSVLYNGNLITFISDHSQGALTPSEYEVVNLENLDGRLRDLYNSVATLSTETTVSLLDLTNRVTQLENNSIELVTSEIVNQDTGKVTPIGSTKGSGNLTVFGSSSEYYRYRLNIGELNSDIKLLNLIQGGSYIGVKVAGNDGNYEGYVRYRINSDGVEYIYTDNPDVARNFYVKSDSGVYYLGIHVLTQVSVTIDSVTDSSLIGEIDNSQSDPIEIISLFQYKESQPSGLVEISTQNYSFTGDGGTGDLSDYPGISFTGTSPIREVTNVGSSSYYPYNRTWRVYNNSEVDITQFDLIVESDTVLSISDFPVNSYLEVIYRGTWSAILILPTKDNITVEYPIIKTGNGNVFELSIDKSDSVGSGGSKLVTQTAVKDFTFSKSEIQELIAQGFKVELVNSLPQQGESNVIYLVPSSDPDQGNIKDEYLWINNAWELVGSTAVDLSDYYTKSEVDNLTKTTMTTTVAVGGIPKGTQITDQTLKKVLMDMLCPYVAPKITGSVNHTLMLYAKLYDDTVITGTATKGSNLLSSMTIDGTQYGITGSSDTVTKTKNVSMQPSNVSQSSRTFNLSVTDSENNTVNGTTKVNFVGGVFLFFSSQDSISTSLQLDFTTYNCQTPRTKPDGEYTLTHSGLEYFYIVVPSSMSVNDVKSGGYVVPMNSPITSITMQQGENDYFVVMSTGMKIYRSTEKQNPGTFNCVINPT
jgi:hypothetical protein